MTTVLPSDAGTGDAEHGDGQRLPGPGAPDRTGTIKDLFAFLAVLMLCGTLTIFAVRAHTMAGSVLYGAAALVVGCFGAWIRLRRTPVRRWRTGAIAYVSPTGHFRIAQMWGTADSPQAQLPDWNGSSSTPTAIQPMMQAQEVPAPVSGGRDWTHFGGLLRIRTVGLNSTRLAAWIGPTAGVDLLGRADRLIMLCLFWQLVWPWCGRGGRTGCRFR